MGPKRTKSPAPAAAPAAEKSTKSAKKAAAPALKVEKVEKPKDRTSEYRKLFDEIDTDNSGTIDDEELYHACSMLFPDAKLTIAQVRKMLEEADADDSGQLDVDEFLAIMKATEAGAAKNAGWNSLASSTRSTLLAIKQAIEPLQDFGSEHSYIDPETDLQIATMGVRIFAEVSTALAVCAAAVPLYQLWDPLFNVFCIFIVYLNFICMCAGQTLPMNLFGIVVTTKDGEVYSFWGMLLFMAIYLVLSPLEVSVAIFTSSRSLTENIMGARIISVQSAMFSSQGLSEAFCMFSFVLLAGCYLAAVLSMSSDCLKGEIYSPTVHRCTVNGRAPPVTFASVAAHLGRALAASASRGAAPMAAKTVLKASTGWNGGVDWE